ncbi:MAG: TrmB family transcriptional regulator [Candidatus Hodarchaeota archaeon]
MTLDLENIETASKNELSSGLKMLGLSTYEASTFYTLVVNLEMTAADLSRQTGIPDSKIYHTLNSLETRGMISIKKGRPSLYKALQPDEAMMNLKQTLDEDYQQKVMMLEALTTKFTRLYESVESKEEMELAYVIHGIRGIFEKMNNLIRQAQRSLLVFVPDMDFWKRVEQSLVEAAGRGIKIELGLHEKFELTPLIERLGTVKKVDCQYGLLLVDDQTLLDRYGAMAVLTQKPTIIQYTREHYNHPERSVLSSPEV